MICIDCGASVDSPYFVSNKPVCPECMEKRIRQSAKEQHDEWEKFNEQQREAFEEEGYWDTVFLTPMLEGEISGSESSQGPNPNDLKESKKPRRRRGRDR